MAKWNGNQYEWDNPHLFDVKVVITPDCYQNDYCYQINLPSWGDGPLPTEESIRAEALDQLKLLCEAILKELS